ncbi:MAG: DHH family phosphoesterase [Myxococcota bacterium]|nr:DHH family phosphoesterase [Myxococcota bacterium]
MMDQSEQLQTLVSKAESVLLTGPASADGDSVGATLALAEGIRGLGVKRVDVAADLVARYRWMPGADDVLANESVVPDYDVVIVMDGDRHRLATRVEEAFKQAKHTVIIDHHGTTDASGYELAILDPTAAATCMQVMAILADWETSITPQIAENLYVGLIFDTGGFRYSNTKPETLRVAARLLETGFDHARAASRILMDKSPAGMRLHSAVSSDAKLLGGGEVAMGTVSQSLMERCGADVGDLDGLVESLLYVDGVEVSVVLVERGPQAVKLSFRSRGLVDVAQLAKSLTHQGGGHAKAAGAFLKEPLAQVAGRLPGVCADAIRVARKR